MENIQDKTVNEDKTLISYCFLAALNNNDNDLVKSVYVPLCKRTLSKYSLTNHGGKDTDIQAAILEIYGINIPLFLVRYLINVCEKEMTRKEKEHIGFVVFEKGKSFQIQNYSFDSLETKYREEVRNANGLQNGFDEFLKAKEKDPTTTPKIIDFINFNKQKLTTFFSSSEIKKIKDKFENTTFIVHAEYFEFIENNNNTLYSIAQKLYLGSVIAAFLETGIDLTAKFENDIRYYLDTQLLLKALDLQNEEDTQPSLELLNIIRNSGGKLVVLDITLNELQHIITKAVSNFGTSPLIITVKNQSINAACFRRKLNKTDLQKIESDLTNIIQKQFGIAIEAIPKGIIEKASKSNDIKELEQQRIRSDSALHDVSAYMYIREKRGMAVASFQKAKYWFVSPNYFFYSYNSSKLTKGHVAEVITPEALTGLLWLKNPNSSGNNVVKLGMSELVAEVIDGASPALELLYGLENNLRKYTKLSTEDYELLLSNLSSSSAKQIQSLNDIGDIDTIKFNKEVLERIEKEKLLREQKQKYIEEIALEKSQLTFTLTNLNEKLNEISTNLNHSNKTVLNLQQENLKLNTDITGIRSTQKKIIIWFCIAILCSVAFVLSVNYITEVIVKTVLKIICGLGGVWSFLNFILNLSKEFRR